MKYIPFCKQVEFKGPVQSCQTQIVLGGKTSWIRQPCRIETKLKHEKGMCVLVIERSKWQPERSKDKRTSSAILCADKDFSRPPTLCCSICLSKVSKAARSPPGAPLGNGPRGRFCTRPGWTVDYIQVYVNIKGISYIFINQEYTQM